MAGSVDIIIPTFGRPQDATRLVASLQPLCGQRDGIIVVDQGAIGPHPDLPAQVKLLQLSKPNLPAARNAGMRSSNADIVLFLDDDVVPLPGLVDGHRSCYADRSIDGVAGFIDDPLFDRTQTHPSRIDLSTGNCMQNFAHSDSGRTISAMGANMSFKRSALLSIGGFDEQYRLRTSTLLLRRRESDAPAPVRRRLPQGHWVPLPVPPVCQYRLFRRTLCTAT